MRRTSLLLPLTLSLISCGPKVEIPNIEICAIAGLISAGADCAKTLTDDTRSMTLTETLDFLEPREGKAAALCMTAIDFNKLKNALEKACEILGSDCTREMKSALLLAGDRQQKLQMAVRQHRLRDDKRNALAGGP